MGADIYLRSVSEKARAEWEPKFNAAVAARNARYPQGAMLARFIPAGVKVPAGTVVIPDDDPLQKAVDEAYAKMHGDGYFRDPYNPGGFFALLGISWWRDVVPMLTKDGHLPIRNARKLKRMIEGKAPITDEMVRAYLNSRRAEFGDPDEVAGWAERWRKDYADLTALLDRSIETGERLYCSL